MAKIKRLNRQYQVGQGDLTLRLQVGEGQFGTSLVRLGDRDLASGAVAMVLIGAGPDVAGQKLLVATTVTDVQRFTNRTSVRYVLTGGPQDAEFEAAAQVDEEGGSVHFRAQFDLTP
jgi:hypothetical protein